MAQAANRRPRTGKAQVHFQASPLAVVYNVSLGHVVSPSATVLAYQYNSTRAEYSSLCCAYQRLRKFSKIPHYNNKISTGDPDLHVTGTDRNVLNKKSH